MTAIYTSEKTNTRNRCITIRGSRETILIFEQENCINIVRDRDGDEGRRPYLLIPWELAEDVGMEIIRAAKERKY